MASTRGRFTMMVAGPCYQRNCTNNTSRCDKGFCPTCCRTLHDHGTVTVTPAGASTRTTAGAAAVPVSTAIQPPPPPVYTPGDVRLVFTQDITALTGPKKGR